MRQVLTLVGATALVATGSACSTGDTGGAAAGDRPSIVVTTNILGDVVTSAVGDLAVVSVIMPPGADPHDFAPSAKQAESMENADLLVVNGAGFEDGMDGVIDAVADGGTPVFVFADAIDLLPVETGDVAAFDPHVWTDPARIAAAVAGLADALGALEGVDADAVSVRANAYIAQLEALDTEIAESVASIPSTGRVLVTSHEVFGYFADRYGFEVVGAIVPSLTTNAETSSRELEQLAAVIDDEGIPAIFAETTQSIDLARALADEVGGTITVVELYSESLGDEGSGADTYIGMMRTNASLIVDALTAK